ncbi:uncharacterized protein LOC115215453 isoform X2 [Octopus sinensis]|uniref:Uncharacterized protein LOC115215453 isoform X2 n=1 Tax=Octopus sinensis TaxID=2607531 RepID=A0A7E6F4R4_9MOLL|nr:uncharacterized protein LOC115215453 isoform X2 [Octopus sinensis]
MNNDAKMAQSMEYAAQSNNRIKYTSSAFRNIIPYVVSYMRLVGKDATLTYNDGIWLTSMGTTGFGLSMIFTTYIEKVLGFRKTILFGSLIQSGSTLLSYYTIQSSYYSFVITEGFLNGAGGSIPYVVTVSCAMKWVPNRKATATGFVLCTHALSATIFTYVSSIYINPDNYQENEVINGEAYFNQKDLLARVPKCFLMLGFVFLVSQLISICMISNPKEETTTIVIQNDAANVDDTEGSGKENKSFQDNDVAIQLQNEANDIQTQNIQDENKKEMMDKSPIGTASEKESEPEEDYFTPFQMVKTKQFYSLWLLTFILSMQYTTIVAVYKIYGMTFISDDNFLTILGSVCAVGNAVAKMSWGLICDKLLFKDSTILLCLSVSLLYLLLNVSSMVGRYFYFIIALLTYVVPGGIYVVMPYIISKSYGLKYYASNCGTVYSSLVISGLLNPFILKGMQNFFGWNWTFFFFEAISFIGLILTVMFQKPRKPERRGSTLSVTEHKSEP